MIFDFNFDQDFATCVLSALQRGRNAAGGLDVVFLDQNCVEQADSMIHSAATGHSILLRKSQAGNGLACVEDLGACACNG